MNCNDCGGVLEQSDIDCREEWRKIYYFCSECNISYVRITCYSQNGLVISDEIKKEK